jgi:Helix-turn-helix domain
MPENRENKFAEIWGEENIQYGTTSIPTIIVRGKPKNLTPGEMNLVLAIASYKHTSEYPFPSVSRLAFDLEVSERQIQLYLKKLKEKGYIEIVERWKSNGGQDSNAYDLKPLLKICLEKMKEKYPGEVEVHRGGEVELQGGDEVELHPGGEVEVHPNKQGLINNRNKQKGISIEEEEEPLEINELAFKQFKKYFNENFPDLYDNEMYNAIYEQMKIQKVSFFTVEEAKEQARFMNEKKEKGEIIADYASYFVGGIKRKRTSQKSAVNKQKVANHQKEQKNRTHAKQNRPSMSADEIKRGFENYVTGKTESKTEEVKLGNGNYKVQTGGRPSF